MIYAMAGYSSLPRSTHSAPLEDSALGGEACNGGCLLSGPAVDIALACCDHLRPVPEEGKPRKSPLAGTGRAAAC